MSTPPADDLELVVQPAEAGTRLDRFLADRLGLGLRGLRRWAEDHEARVNDRTAAKGARLAAGDRVALPSLPPAADWRPAPEPDLEIRLAHADAYLLAADKPAGMPCHPNRPEERGTLVAGLLASYPELAGVGDHAREPGLVNRLDSDTSGLVLLARTEPSFRALKRSFGWRQVAKQYLALVHGAVDAPGRVDLPLAHHPGDARRMVAVLGPRTRVRGKPLPARTEFEPQQRLPEFTLVRVRARTGRMHQVRVHLAAAGFPVAGDALYAPRGSAPPAGLARQFLHASGLDLPHPAGRRLRLQSPLPPDLDRVLEALARNRLGR